MRNWNTHATDLVPEKPETLSKLARLHWITFLVLVVSICFLWWIIERSISTGAYDGTYNLIGNVLLVVALLLSVANPLLGAYIAHRFFDRSLALWAIGGIVFFPVGTAIAFARMFFMVRQRLSEVSAP